MKTYSPVGGAICVCFVRMDLQFGARPCTDLERVGYDMGQTRMDFNDPHVSRVPIKQICGGCTWVPSDATRWTDESDVLSKPDGEAIMDRSLYITL